MQSEKVSNLGPAKMAVVQKRKFIQLIQGSKPGCTKMVDVWKLRGKIFKRTSYHLAGPLPCPCACRGLYLDAPLGSEGRLVWKRSCNKFMQQDGLIIDFNDLCAQETGAWEQGRLHHTSKGSTRIDLWKWRSGLRDGGGKRGRDSIRGKIAQSK